MLLMYTMEYHGPPADPRQIPVPMTVGGVSLLDVRLADLQARLRRQVQMPQEQPSRRTQPRPPDFATSAFETLVRHAVCRWRTFMSLFAKDGHKANPSIPAAPVTRILSEPSAIMD